MILLQSCFRTKFHLFYDRQRPRSRFATKQIPYRWHESSRIFANLWIRPCVSVQRSMENESTRCGKTARGGSLFRRFLTCHREVLPFSQMLSTCSFTLRSSALSRFFGSEKRSICRHWSLATFPYVDLALHSHPSFFLSFLRFRLDRVVPTLTKSFKMLLRWVQRSFLSYWYNEARVDVIELVSFPFQPIISSPKTWWLIRRMICNAFQVLSFR